MLVILTQNEEALILKYVEVKQILTETKLNENIILKKPNR